jgi:hypothetical protein
MRSPHPPAPLCGLGYRCSARLRAPPISIPVAVMLILWLKGRNDRRRTSTYEPSSHELFMSLSSRVQEGISRLRMMRHVWLSHCRSYTGSR